MYSEILNFCFPALFFLIIVLFDIVYIAFGKSNNNKTRPLDKKIKILLLLSLCALGWSFIINSTCGYQQNMVAWGLTAIPLLYLSFTLYK
jgi:tellurite resistance protein TehA-like permease